jgi:hypothetical protein
MGLANILVRAAGIDLIIGRVAYLSSFNKMDGSVIGICPAARVSFHITPDLKRLDLYIGGHGGLRNFYVVDDQLKDGNPDLKNSEFFAGHIGARVNIYRVFGVFLEANLGVNVPNPIKAGVALKF